MKGAVPIRTRKAWGEGEDKGAMGLLVERFSMYGSGELTGEAHTSNGILGGGRSEGMV